MKLNCIKIELITINIVGQLYNLNTCNSIYLRCLTKKMLTIKYDLIYYIHYNYYEINNILNKNIIMPLRYKKKFKQNMPLFF